MRVPRIFTTQTLSDECTVTLEEAPSAHLARVLRMGIGDALILFNGLGGQYPAQITALSKKQVTIRTASRDNIERESPLGIHLGIGISRGERMDWVIQKATELGVRAVTPLTTERTEVKLTSPRAEKKRLHWQQVAISACEQGGRNCVPTVHPIANLKAWAANLEADYKIVLHHRTDAQLSQEKQESIALLIGPEGGLSDTEIQAAESAGFHSLCIGPRVMRTETAPLAAIAILQAKWGDMSL